MMRRDANIGQRVARQQSYTMPALVFLVCALCCCRTKLRADETADAAFGQPVQSLVSEFCIDCHTGGDASAQLDLAALRRLAVEPNVDAWEKVVRKLRSRQMPPVDVQRPDEETYDAALSALERELDRVAREHPHPGRTETFRRLTRTEYQNAIRDLLAVEIDAADLLPKDEVSHGFDNITVGELSPTLLNRYVTAARKIARTAVGGVSRVPGGDTFRVRPDVTQEDHIPGLPVGTRGGTLILYNFPQSGEYEVTVRLTRDRNEEVEGLRGRHELEVLLDRERVAGFTVEPPPNGSRDFSKVDAHLVARFHVTAGPHKLGVTFPRTSHSLVETSRQPYKARFNMHRHPRLSPAVFQVSITGPYEATGPGDTPSRQLLFVRRPRDSADEDACAKEIISTLARRAWRRDVNDDDISGPMEFFDADRQEAGFEAGIESAVTAVLVNPEFLFRIERDPADSRTGDVYPISDVELASRLSFFLWSSIPDDELLDLAVEGQLRDSEVPGQQVRRMLADERSESLVTNFAGQWLYLRNLESVTPDMRLFPDFDDNLRQAMKQETELFFADIVHNDRSVLDLLRADYTFLNERLAAHYEIPHIQGSRFRRVELEPNGHRGGLLRHGSILTVTSYATRTSPVIRGHWILQNLIGAPPPPPPANVPALKDNTVEASLPVRARLAQHRADPNCAGCHNIMDPVGFALENFDAVGRWRDLEVGEPVDASGGLPDGSEFTGVEGLEDALLRRPELFVGTVVEKLMTYALGRGLDAHDAAAIRNIVRDAAADDYRFSSLIRGVVNSVPFQMRTAE
ncbi:MAG: DUF1592 domain-containing protein [Planctomycetaceae bacterium]